MKIYDTVKIIPLDREGILEEISESVTGFLYRIAYWNNGERYSVWVTPKEIDARPR